MSVSEFVPFFLGIASLSVLALARSAKTETFDNSFISQPKHTSASAFRSPSTDGLRVPGDQDAMMRMYQQSLAAAAPSKAQVEALTGTGYSEDHSRPAGNGEFSMLSHSQSMPSGMHNVKNAGNFVSSSLLPKPAMSGNAAWDFNAPSDVLASPSFLSPVQMFGVDTTMASNKNQSYDIRGGLQVPLGNTGIWNQGTSFPSLPTKPLV